MDRFGKNTKLSAASLMPIVAQIARSCNLGLLCVDEIQNLSVAKSGGAEKMLSFFVTLSNSIGLPTILIGTPTAQALFSDFRIARRGSGQGDVAWRPMKKSDPSWSLFIEGIWDHQWVRNPTELTTEFNDAMYEASCPSVLEREDIEEIALSLRKYWGINEEPISNIVFLLEKNGFVITSLATDTYIIDVFSQRQMINNRERYVIILGDGKQSASRRQFDTAHELGHMLLHNWNTDYNDIYLEEHRLIEHQADSFAGAFFYQKMHLKST